MAEGMIVVVQVLERPVLVGLAVGRVRLKLPLLFRAHRRYLGKETPGVLESILVLGGLITEVVVVVLALLV
jgi:hypothetical protein